VDPRRNGARGSAGPKLRLSMSYLRKSYAKTLEKHAAETQYEWLFICQKDIRPVMK
jgi:hypothetical protein